MYLYYLLGYRLLGFGSGSDVKEEERTHSSSSNPHLRHRKKKGGHHRSHKSMPLRQLLMRVTPDEYEQVSGCKVFNVLLENVNKTFGAVFLKSLLRDHLL